MKYIRTKDGIHWNIFDGALSPQTWIGEPIAESDTIAELCDVYVIIDKYTNHKWILDSFFKLSKDYDTYGAIWTESGLKYVAKMNDNGELELLWNIK